MEDGNRVTKVKYAGTLVVHWTKPLLRQHRCPRESSGPYGRYALRRTRYRVSLFKRGNGMRIEGRVKIFLQFFLFIYAKKKRKKEKEKDGNIFDRERKIYFLVKKKKKTEISQTQISLHSMSNEFDVTNLLFPCKILDSLFLDIPISRVSVE